MPLLSSLLLGVSIPANSPALALSTLQVGWWVANGNQLGMQLRNVALCRSITIAASLHSGCLFKR